MMAADFSLVKTRGAVSQLVQLASVPSTNSYAKSNQDGLLDFSLVLSTDQTKGRGRLGREWSSRPGEMLAASYVVPTDRSSDMSWLPLIAGASVVHSLQAHGVEGASLKWPNDVVIESGKLAGVLCEWTGDNRVIVGLGINLIFTNEMPPSHLATSLARHHESWEVILDEVLSGWITGIRNWLEGHQASKGDAARHIVKPVMGTLGRSVVVEEPTGERWEGIAEDLDPDGHLLVRGNISQRVHTVVASDITHLRQ